MTLSAYNPSTKTFYENDATKPLDSDDLVQALADSRAMAVPAAAGQLLGGSGTAGTALAITLGTNLSLTGTTLNAVGSSGAVPLTNITQGGAVTGQAITWNGTTWTPTTLAAGTTYTGVAPIAINGSGAISLSQSSAAPGQVLAWSGTAWAPTTHLAAASNLSDVANVGAARTNLGLGNISTLPGTAQGQVAYYNGSAWTVLAPGTAGQVLTTGGAAANPIWTTVSGSGSGLSDYGTPTIITASGSQTVTLGNPRTFVEIQNTAGVTAFTLPNGTVSGQLALIYVQPTTQQHTISGTFFGTSNTLFASSPNVGFALHAVWSAVMTAWIPLNYDGGYKIGDLPPAAVVASGDKVGLFAAADGKDYGATIALVRGLRSASVNFGMGATVAGGTIYIPIPNAATVKTLSADANFGGLQTFTVAANIGGTPITGLSGLAVTGGSTASATATAANTVTAGQEVALVFSSPVSSPTGGTVTLTWQE